MANPIPPGQARGDVSLDLDGAARLSRANGFRLSYRPRQHYPARSHLELLVRRRHQQSVCRYSPNDPGADTADPGVLVVWPEEPSCGAISASWKICNLNGATS